MPVTTYTVFGTQIFFYTGVYSVWTLCSRVSSVSRLC